MTDDIRRPDPRVAARCPLFAGPARGSPGRGEPPAPPPVPPGEVIFHEGDPADALHVVAAGSVKIVLSSDEGTRRSSPLSIRATSSASCRCSTGLRGLPPRRRSRPPRPSACRATRFSRRWAAARPSRRPAPLIGQGAAAADRPRRGAPLPRPRRTAGEPPGAPRGTGDPPAAHRDGRLEATLEWPFTQSDLAARLAPRVRA